MRCDEIQERFVELLYEAESTPASEELRQHLLTCPSCREELEELRRTRKCLQLWKDEEPLRSVPVASREFRARKNISWKPFRYAAIAAMAVITFLALANTRITWNKDGFTFSTHLFSSRESEKDHYTKAEVRDLVKQALDDSELRTNETNYLMMQKMLDTVEQDRWMDLRLVSTRYSKDRNKN
jgi:hypothetical protein